MSSEYFKNVKHPRAVVMINGNRAKVSSVEVTTSTFFISDTYYIEMPVEGQPKGIDLAFFLSDQVFTCKIYIGFPTDWDNYSENDLDLQIVGDSNEVEIDMFNGIVRISGKDLSSRLMGNQITKTFANNTGSQIAKIFADSNELKSDITENSQILGTFYQDQQALMMSNTTQWDLLCSAAQQINFVVYVKNETLYFKPRPDENSKDPYILKWVPPTPDNASASFKGTGLRIYKNSGLTKNISVTVKVPYSTKTGADFSVKVSSKLKSPKGSGGSASQGANKYVYSYPGLTQQQAHDKALQILRDLTIHGIRLEVKVAGDNILQKDSVIKLTGTSTSADQMYFPDHITRRLSNLEGYYMDISAKNKPDNVELES